MPGLGYVRDEEKRMLTVAAAINGLSVTKRFKPTGKKQPQQQRGRKEYKAKTASGNVHVAL